MDPLTICRTVDGLPVDMTVNPSKGPTGWQHIARHFVDCIVDGAKCICPLRHGRIVQSMMEAVLKSARTGREVRVP